MNKEENTTFNWRNKEYGAFNLRKQYNRVMMISISVAVLVFVSAFIFPYLYYRYHIQTITEPMFIVSYGGMEKPTSENIIEPKHSFSNKPLPKSLAFTVPEVVSTDSIFDSTSFYQDVLNQEKNRDTLSGGDPNGMGTGEMTGGDSVYMHVQMNPSFPGGLLDMKQFLTQNISYPAYALDNKIEGTVRVSFIVEKDGYLSDIRVERKIGGGCDEEAIRVVKKMPPWNPGRQNNKNVRVRVALPLRFTMIR